MKHIFVLIALVSALLTRPLLAQSTVGFVVEVPTQPYTVGVLTDIQVPAFDPALGTLTKVSVNLAMRGGCQYFAENCSAGDALAKWTSPIRSGLRMYAPDNTVIFTQVFSVDWPSWTIALGADDGVLDWAGASGAASDLFSQAQTSNPYTTSRGLSLSRFVGVGTLPFHVERLGGNQFTADSGCAYARIRSTIGARLAITYTYQ